SEEEVQGLFNTHLKGREVRAFLVHGVNSLKSIEPATTELVGRTIDSVAFSTPTAFSLQLDGVRLEVDLQRTGGLRWIDGLQQWTLGMGAMPTAQLILDAGGVNFVEPGKTKRIAFRVGF